MMCWSRDGQAGEKLAGKVASVSPGAVGVGGHDRPPAGIGLAAGVIRKGSPAMSGAVVREALVPEELRVLLFSNRAENLWFARR